MSDLFDVVEQSQNSTTDSPPFQLVSKFVDVQISYQYTGKKASELTPVLKSAEAERCFRAVYEPERIALQESFYVMALNKANRLIAIVRLSSGSTTGTTVDIKIAMMYLIALNCQIVIICHNHPSGNMNPSGADLDLTVKFKHACSLLDIRLADHMILSPDPGKYYSFVDDGAL